MATKIRIKRAAAPVVEPEEEEAVVEEPVEEAEPEDTEAMEAEEDTPEEEEEVSPYDDMSLGELRAELKARKLDDTGRKSVLIERLIDNDTNPPPAPAKAAPKAQPKAAAPAKAAAPVAKQVVKPAAPAKPIPAAPKAAPKTASTDGKILGLDGVPGGAPKAKVAPKAVEPEPVATFSATSISDILDAMIQGNVLHVTKVSDAEWIMSLEEAKQLGPIQSHQAASSAKQAGLRGDAFDKEVMTPDYYKLMHVDAGNGKAWSAMTAEEKVAFADAMGVEYVQAADPKVTMLNLVRAVLEGLGIEKYKPEYKSVKARDALRA